MVLRLSQRVLVLGLAMVVSSIVSNTIPAQYAIAYWAGITWACLKLDLPTSKINSSTTQLYDQMAWQTYTDNLLEKRAKIPK